MPTKKTTTGRATGAKPDDESRAKSRQLADEIRKLEEAQAARAIDRAIRWARLLDQLEELLDGADTLYRFGIPLDADHVEKEHARAVADPRGWLGDKPPTIGEIRAEQAQIETCLLAQDLQLAENWLPMIGDAYRAGDSSAIATVRQRLDGAWCTEPFLTTPAEELADAIAKVRLLLDADVARAKSFESVPSEADLSLARRLCDQPKTAKELAVEIAGKGNAHAANDKAVGHAIERLRHVHGFELPNVRGSGYTLSPGDRARLKRSTPDGS